MVVCCWKAYKLVVDKKPSERVKDAFEPYTIFKETKYGKLMSEDVIDKLKEAYRHPCESRYRDPEY